MNSDGLIGLVILVLIIRCLCGGGGRKKISFRGHGYSRAQAVAHEKRHVRVLRGLNIAHHGYRVWQESKGWWAGITTINKSSRNMDRWDALGPTKQAAVYMAGSMGPLGPKGEQCSDDLAAVDARCSRSAARSIASKYV
jgi:hypothetical protein